MLLSASLLSPQVAPTRSAVQMLAVGEKAPSFELLDAAGKMVRSSTFIGRKPTVLFFFPSVDSPGCTKEAIAFSQSLKEFGSAQVVGISGGQTDKYQDWIEENNLQSIMMLNDKGDEVRKLFKVPKAAFGLLPGRVTYVLNKNGACIEVYDNLLDAESHVSCALNAF
ncbi:alkyl hydroperoxide reductase/ thiol specific antioxidant/ Mal allergen [Pavlovales sp. CCMP2436]|nr:alkyl hydroperoxide reductase/ thiol specific antioxidant/ Mal allergen [Pavlovales sp. CCMP2436]